MSIVRRETEISVLVGAEPPAVSATSVIAWYPKIEVFTMRSYCNRDGVVLLLVTTNAIKTLQVLEAAGFECVTNSVVLVGPINRTGWAAPISAELTNAGIEINYSYTSHRESDRHYVVFKTSDDDKAIQVLTTGTLFQSLAGSNFQLDRETVIPEESNLFQQARKLVLS